MFKNFLNKKTGKPTRKINKKSKKKKYDTEPSQNWVGCFGQHYVWVRPFSEQYADIHFVGNGPFNEITS